MDKSAPCTDCELVFTSQSKLKTHISQAHGGPISILLNGEEVVFERDSQQKYTCSLCAHKSGNRKAFKTHMKRKHTEEKSSVQHSIEVIEEVFMKESESNLISIQDPLYLNARPFPDGPAIIVCVACGIQVTHLKSHARKHDIDTDDVMTTIRELEVSFEIAEIPNKPIEPIEGLTLRKGFYCLECSYCSAGIDGIRKHARTMEHQFTEERTGFMQQHGKAPGEKTYFRVQLMEDTMPTESLDIAIHEAIEKYTKDEFRV